MNILTIIFLFSILLVSGDKCDDPFLQKLADTSDYIVIGEVAEVKTPPGVWSGLALMSQEVQYKVKEVLKGKYDMPVITVSHLIVKNSLTADSEKPQLSPKMFFKGNQLILFLKQINPPTRRKAYFVPDANCGVALLETETLPRIRRLLPAK